MDSTVAFLDAVRRKGVELWSQDGQLHYRGPKGALTREEIDRIRACKGQLIAELTQRPLSYRAPLTFSQLERWNHHELGRRRSIRQVASALALRGALRVDALRLSLGKLVRRHDALRTRIVACGGSPMQEIDERWHGELAMEDLTGTPRHLIESAIRRLVDELVLQPIDVAVGPLFGARLAKLSEDQHVLVLAMEHIISDGISLGIIERDLLGLYACELTAGPSTLPPVSMQLADYAALQRSGHQAWLERHGRYWTEHVLQAGRTRFPEDSDSRSGERPGWGIVSFGIGPQRTAGLREWSRLRHTTLVMAAFTAFVACVLRWCDVWEAMLRYQSDGRFDPRLVETVGYFAAVVYVHVQARETDTFIDLLEQATRAYCTGYEHADASCMTAPAPRPAIARNASFNWLPRTPKAESAAAHGMPHGLRCAPMAFEHPMVRHMDVDSEPSMLLRESDETIAGEIYFPRDRFSPALIERFGEAFLTFIDALLARPHARIRDIELPYARNAALRSDCRR